MEDDKTNDPSLLLLIESLKEGLTLHATDGTFPGENERYAEIRHRLRREPTIYRMIPECVRISSSLGEFWRYIKQAQDSYQGRRVYLQQEFAPVIEYLEQRESDLSLLSIEESLAHLSSEAVQDIWRKALHRRREDPDGAITAARTLLETVCKHILDDKGETYTRNDDLPKLWRLVAEQLQLTPEQHQPTDIKALLGNCQAVVNGLANLRNAAGDAHGQGRRPMKARPKHAELAVNLAGTMASFLVASMVEQKDMSDKSNT